MNILQHPDGFRFGIINESKSPSPTLFVLASRIEECLKIEDYNKAGRLLRADGFMSVSLDVPCHGENVQKGEPTSLPGWRYRLEKGENFAREFAGRVSALLDHLIREKLTDPARAAVIGT